MLEWLQLEERRQLEILNALSGKTGLPASAIEKDWWVTLVLRITFTTEWASCIVFKGGTSLSKSWALIERFSEDIDLAIDREVLGFSGPLSKTKIGKLRKASCQFVCGEFKEAVETGLLRLGVKPEVFSLDARPAGNSDADPQVLELQYGSVVGKDSYLKERVLLEVGARSLREPCSSREIQSIIGQQLPGQPFSGTPFPVQTVEPRRTFLEKAFLLHEEFSKPTDQIRSERMSRHLYDLERLMDTEHGYQALQDKVLYQGIVDHRQRFTPIRGIAYTNHVPKKISFIPPAEVAQVWEQDYRSMTESMIYGEALSYDGLMQRMYLLQERFRNAPF